MDRHLAKKIGDGARAARRSHGWTQDDAAERIGVSVEFYARIERGGTLPSVPTLQRMAAALGVGADVLLGLAGRECAAPPASIAAEAVAEDASGQGRARRLLMRRVRSAGPRTVRLLNLLAAELERQRR
jgi:transcriptional regulator with XRE-family HTH domain